jgi:CHAD domain-containing protein
MRRRQGGLLRTGFYWVSETMSRRGKSATASPSMAFKIEIDEPLARGITRIARERIERIIESLSEKPHPNAESIHSARKDLKSMRALLRLASGSIPDETRRTENLLFRDTGRSLSPLRDSHALIETLQKFAKVKSRIHSNNSKAPRGMRSHFIGKICRSIEQEAVKKLPEDTLRQLNETLLGAARNVAHWFDGLSFEPGNEWEVFVGFGLRRTYRRGKNIVAQLESLGRENAGDETWHELRKCAKALGYQLRLLRQIWPEVLETLLAQVDQLSEMLGDDHDLAVLRARVLSEPYNANETQEGAEIRRSFIGSLDRRRRKIHVETYQIARRIYAEKPRQFVSRIRCYWIVSLTKPAKTFAQAPRQVSNRAPKRGTAGRPSQETIKGPARRRVRVQSLASG